MPPETQPSRPVWAEISRGALLRNYQRLRKQAEAIGAECVCVVKADAYGHGAVECRRVLRQAGARWFAVTSVAEGVRLREAEGAAADGADRILVLSGLYRGEAPVAVKYGLTPVLSAPQQLGWLAAAAEERAGVPAEYPFHVEIDTGMARQGVRWDDAALVEAFGEGVGTGSPLRLEGLMTHLASPDEPASPQSGEQLERFASAISGWAAAGLRPEILHCGNSATLFESAQTDLLRAIANRGGGRLLLRPGIALYGYGPHARSLGIGPVLSWKTRVTALRWLEAGEPVSYNATFRCKRRTRIALLPVGYADGYNRRLSNVGHVLIRGEEARVAGRVTMDQIMVDVTDIRDVELDDEAALLGRQRDAEITAEETARLTGTISYEVLCAISARVPRLSVA